MSETLYRKYRPLKFSEIIGQQHIVKTLSNSIANNRIGQAYLFTGPRGTGKTTLARIFAKTTNCLSPVKNKNGGMEPCLKCENCQAFQKEKFGDVIEIDAASNTGVDNIRDLRETAKLPPLQGNFKVYIIDEAHMLSAGAFNALLKILEEPPTHIIFILATTELHKIPETIVSRCQKFDFNKLNFPEITEKLSRIASEEKIKIDSESLEIIASMAEGGMRDAESLFEQIIAMEKGKITAKKIMTLFGLAENKFLEEASEFIFNNDTDKALLLINKIYKEGFNLEFFAKKWLDYFRKLMIISINSEIKNNLISGLTEEQAKKLLDLSQRTSLEFIVRAIEELTQTIPQIKTASIPQLPLEVMIIKLTNPFPSQSNQEKNIRPTQDTPKASKESLSNKENETKSTAKNINTQNTNKKQLAEDTFLNELNTTEKKEGISKSKQKSNDKRKKNQVNIDPYQIEKVWKEIIEEIKANNFSLSMTLTNSKPIESKTAGMIRIAVLSDFHKDIINKPENRLTIKKISNKITELEFDIEAVTADEVGIKLRTILPKEEITENNFSENKEQPSSNHNQDSLLSDALNLLGGTVVEET